MSNFSITTLFPSFHSSGIDKKEFEDMIKEAIKKEHPHSIIKEIRYLKDGLKVVLNNNETIYIEIDWNEIIVS